VRALTGVHGADGVGGGVLGGRGVRIFVRAPLHAEGGEGLLLLLRLRLRLLALLTGLVAVVGQHLRGVRTTA